MSNHSNQEKLDLVTKMQHQEDTIAQLMKIIAATNNRVFDLQLKFKKLEQYIQAKS